MQSYTNYSGNSNVVSFEIGSIYITVQFSTGHPYTYSYGKAGVAHVEKMKELARAGRGLNSYINLYCKYLYD